MSEPLNSLNIADFSGGQTDYKFDAQPNQFSFLKNITIDVNKKPYTRYGFESIDTSNAQLPSGNSPVQYMLAFNNEIYAFNAENIYYYTTSWQTLDGVSPNKAMPQCTTSNFISAQEWKNQVYLTDDGLNRRPMKIYVDSSTRKCRSVGLPQPATYTVSASSGTGSNWVFAVTYLWTYNVNGQTFTEESAPRLFTAPTNVGSVTLDLTATVLTNTSSTNYDLTNITKNIYRTVNNGVDFYLVTNVANSAITSGAISTSDASLILNQSAYFNGGVLDNDEPPIAKYLYINNGTGYYANCKIGSILYPTRLYQSKLDDPDSVPLTSYIEFDEDIVGVSGFNGKVIVSTKNRIYRLDGVINDLGQGSLSYELIEDKIGAVSHNSFVFTREGLFFAGKNGFYVTDSYSVKRISETLNPTCEVIFNSDTKRKRCYGVFDRINNRVLWSIQYQTGSINNDCFIVCDIKHGINQQSCFTFWFNGTYLYPNHATYLNNILYHGDFRGFVLKWTDGLLTDARVTTSLSASKWGTATILYNISTSCINFNIPYVRKWVPYIKCALENESNISLQIESINDDSGITSQLKPIRFRGNVTWGVTPITWGVTPLIWGFTGLIEQKRNFPSGGLRCSYKSIILSNAYTIVYRSDDYATCTVDSVAKNATISSGTLPQDLYDYYISFSNDNYSTDHLISSFTSTVITFVDSGNTSRSGSYEWYIRGYPKGERLGLISLDISFTPITRSYRPYQATQEDTGVNT